jgi:hypothetical protein
MELKKIQRKFKRPVLERTIYLREKNSFVPKKCSSSMYLEEFNLTATSTLSTFYPESGRKTERKQYKCITS